MRTRHVPGKLQETGRLPAVGVLRRATAPRPTLPVIPSVPGPARGHRLEGRAEDGLRVVAVHAGDEVVGDELGARRAALVLVRAAAESRARPSSSPSRGRACRAPAGPGGAAPGVRPSPRRRASRSSSCRRRRTRRTRCTGRRPSRGRRPPSGTGHRVGLGRRARPRRDEAARLLDRVEGAPVGHEVLQDRERPRAERLDHDQVAVLEAAHVGLARGDAAVRPVRLAVDRERARPADPLAAVVRERDRLLAPGRELVVEDVEHLEERHVGIHAAGGVVDEAPPPSRGPTGARRAG